MIKVSPCGKGSTVEICGPGLVVAEEYAALTLQIAESYPDVLIAAQHLIELEASKNGKTDKCND